jgi:hypothetical protein
MLLDVRKHPTPQCRTLPDIWKRPTPVCFHLSTSKSVQPPKISSRSASADLQSVRSKINYRIHTDVIKEHIIPNIVTKEQIFYTYAEMKSNSGDLKSHFGEMKSL